MADDDLPASVTINAWTETQDESRGSLAADTKRWATRPAPSAMLALAAREPDVRDWKDPEVGWGLLIPHRPEYSDADNAALKDMPEALRELVKFRNGVVLGWDKADGIDALIRYLDGGRGRVPIGDTVRGTEQPHALPQYILIYGGPDKIPWVVQYTLNLCAGVGRLDLDELGLNNYVAAAIAEWKETPLDVSKCLLWSVDQGGTEITTLMQQTVASPLLAKLRGDADIGDRAVFLTKGDATHAKLIEALKANKPALVVTTSHGKTGPLDKPDVMRRDLGLLVDQNNHPMPLTELMEAWDPNGAIWYAHACCSAGCDTGTAFAGLFGTSPLAHTLESIGKLGAQSAPLPLKLLGAKRPLRAFIGHVEPTFDWTLTTFDMKQALTASITEALYRGLFRANPLPIGPSFSNYFDQVGTLFNRWHEARLEVGRFVPGADRRALRCQLGALDRRSLVIHGDPAVALPALG